MPKFCGQSIVQDGIDSTAKNGPNLFFFKALPKSCDKGYGKASKKKHDKLGFLTEVRGGRGHRGFLLIVII